MCQPEISFRGDNIVSVLSLVWDWQVFQLRVPQSHWPHVSSKCLQFPWSVLLTMSSVVVYSKGIKWFTLEMSPETSHFFYQFLWDASVENREEVGQKIRRCAPCWEMKGGSIALGNFIFSRMGLLSIVELIFMAFTIPAFIFWKWSCGFIQYLLPILNFPVIIHVW